VDQNGKADALTVELLNEFDIYSDELAQHMPEVLAYARTQCPVIETASGYSVITRYDDVRRVLSDPGTFSSAWGVPRGKMEPPIVIDPPDHRDYRTFLNRFFSFKALEPNEERIRALANRAIDVWIGRGEVDFMREFADPYTASVLGNIILGDSDAAKWTGQLQTGMEHQGVAGDFDGVFSLAREVARRKLEEERTNPTRSDSIVKAIVEARVADRPLSQEEQEGTLVTLFLGGLDTTKATLTGIMLYIAQHPEAEERLRSVHWNDPALNEAIRILSPVPNFGRVCTRDVSVGGHQFSEGDKLLVNFWSANHDETAFANADEWDFDRDARGHVGFGYGIHRCIGTQLARLQIAIALQELFRRISSVRLSNPDISYSAGLSRYPRGVRLEFDSREGV
jgi:cytochrome P450